MPVPSSEARTKLRPALITSETAAVGADRFLAALRQHVPATFIKFLIVGGIGYLINQSVLFLIYDTPLAWFLPAEGTSLDLGPLTHPDIRLLISSIASVETAIFFQFQLHERWTFRARRQTGWIALRFLKFNLTSSLSPIIIVLTVNTLTPLFGISPYISNTIGVMAGVTWNWTWNTLVIWRRTEMAR